MKTPKKTSKKTGRPKGTLKPGIKSLSAEQLEAFLIALEKQNNLRNEIMFKMALFFAMRVGELALLKRSDIVLGSRSITIAGLKGGRTRTYVNDLPEKSWQLLTKWLKKNKEEMVFPISTQAIKNAFKTTAKIAGLSSSFSSHSLRHTQGISMAKQKDSPIEIMLWLRQRRVNSAQVYFEQVQFEQDGERMKKRFEAIL